jgi:hypothetical protein
MVMSSSRLRPEKVCADEVQQQLQVTDASYRQLWRPIIIENKCLKIMSTEEREKLVAVPRWRPDTRTDWPNDRRHKKTFTFEEKEINSSQNFPYIMHFDFKNK